MKFSIWWIADIVIAILLFACACIVASDADGSQPLIFKTILLLLIYAVMIVVPLFDALHPWMSFVTTNFGAGVTFVLTSCLYTVALDQTCSGNNGKSCYIEIVALIGVVFGVVQAVLGDRISGLFHKSAGGSSGSS